MFKLFYLCIRQREMPIVASTQYPHLKSYDLGKESQSTFNVRRSVKTMNETMAIQISKTVSPSHRRTSRSWKNILLTSWRRLLPASHSLSAEGWTGSWHARTSCSGTWSLPDGPAQSRLKNLSTGGLGERVWCNEAIVQWYKILNKIVPMPNW